MKAIFKYSGVLILFIFLILVRAFENDLFYDPFIKYFENDYLYSEMPVVEYQKLFINLFFRYCINGLISLTIIFILFKKKSYFKFASAFYGIAFVLLVSAFLILVHQEFSKGYLLTFYIRRFLIHPLFLLILLPIFFYQNRLKPSSDL